MWKTNRVTKEERGGVGGINWETWVDIYTLPYIKEVTNKDLWYSTRSSIQYSVIAYMGVEYKKSGYLLCITDSLCYTAETNATLQINCIPTKINFKKQ